MPYYSARSESLDMSRLGGPCLGTARWGWRGGGGGARVCVEAAGARLDVDGTTRLLLRLGELVVGRRLSRRPSRPFRLDGA